MNDWEIEKVAEMLQKLGEFKGTSTKSDTIPWKHDRDGRFSVKRLYNRKVKELPRCRDGPRRQVRDNSVPVKVKCLPGWW